MSGTPTMAEVLSELDEHRPTHAGYEGGWWELACQGCDVFSGKRLSHLDWSPHDAHRLEVFTELMEAVKRDAAVEALTQAADELERHQVDEHEPGQYWEPGEDEDTGLYTVTPSRWLRDRATKIGETP